MRHKMSDAADTSLYARFYSSVIVDGDPVADTGVRQSVLERAGSVHAVDWRKSIAGLRRLVAE